MSGMETTVHRTFLNPEGRLWLERHLLMPGPGHSHQVGYPSGGDDVDLVVAHEVAHGITGLWRGLSNKIVFHGPGTSPHEAVRVLQLRQGYPTLKDHWTEAVAVQKARRR